MTRTKFVITLLLTPLLVAGTLLAWIWWFGAAPRFDKSDCIIVLGCRLYGTVPSPFLKARLDEGLRLYNEGYARYIVVSGGQGPGEDITEARAMKLYLVENGVDESHVLEEDKSTSTETNLRFSLEKMKERGLETAIVVSNSYHLARASLMAGRIGLDAGYSGVRLPQYRQWEMSGLIREIPALAYALLMVW
jgi:uncharacterized SAM-binding protein YcdF (DUF218 family)